MKNSFFLSLIIIFVLSSCAQKKAVNAQDESTSQTAKTVSQASSAAGKTDVKKANPSEQMAQDEQLIKDYIAKNNLTAERDESGVYYVIEKPGSAEKPKLTDQVTVHYHGMLLDGTVFDSSVDRGQPATFPLNGVVMGWQKGIPKFGKGGKGKLIIPSALAYGERAAGSIPPNSVLVFDVEIIDFSDPMAADDKTIQDYIAKNNLKATKLDSGVYYTVEKEGGAEKPTIQNEVTCHYHGTLLDGTVFDSSVDRGQPATFPLSRVIPGWQKGIPQYGKGGKGKLIIPSALAYGPRPTGKIPPNSVLIFDVEIIDFK